MKKWTRFYALNRNGWSEMCFISTRFISSPTASLEFAVVHYLVFFCWECLYAVQIQRWENTLKNDTTNKIISTSRCWLCARFRPNAPPPENLWGNLNIWQGRWERGGGGFRTDTVLKSIIKLWKYKYIFAVTPQFVRLSKILSFPFSTLVYHTHSISSI